ncbi:MAG: mechanosensitive ion channel [Opitutales bacterium]|nr:mechanosensitive ion channel [Opitutales bacterium]
MLSSSFWTEPYRIGEVSFTPLSLLIGFTLLTVLVLVQALIKRLLTHRVFPRFGIQLGLANAYATLLGYAVLIIGLTVITPVALQGINWATFSVMLGAISFGVGFGLRNVADNFVSGLIILLERPIKVGDRVDVDGYEGVIVNILARSTTIRTNDNIDVIIPNSRFISESVTNWSHNDDKVRFKMPIGVHYKSDPFEVEKVLLQAANQCPDVLPQPAPSVRFIAFGDSSLNFELRVWSTSLMHKPRAFISQVNFTVWKHLRDAGIQVPYPQRDLYIKEMPK